MPRVGPPGRGVTNSNKDFSDIVSAGEMIEAGVKQGKIEASEAKKPTFKKKEKNASPLLKPSELYVVKLKSIATTGKQERTREQRGKSQA